MLKTVRYLLIVAATCFVVSSEAIATPQSPSRTQSHPTKVDLQQGRISFIPPAGFTAMSPAEIALKFPNYSGNRPQYVYANARRTVSIAITMPPAQLTLQQLPELKNFLPKFLTRAMPKIQWLQQEFVTINNLRWLQLEFITPALDTDIHNDTYFTSFDSKMLGFNFNSTVEQYNSVRAELRKSRDSIVIKQ